MALCYTHQLQGGFDPGRETFRLICKRLLAMLAAGEVCQQIRRASGASKVHTSSLDKILTEHWS